MNSSYLKFETPRLERAAWLVWAAVIGVACLLMSFAVGGVAFAILNWALAVPLGLAIALSAVAWAIMIRLGWKLTVAPLRFRIILGKEAVEVGRGWFKRVFPYDAIEMIALPEGKLGKEHGVGLRGIGGDAFIYLSAADETACAALLREMCRNAIFVDHSGREHLPLYGDRPLLTLRVLYRRHRSLVLGSLCLFFFATLFGIGHGAVLLQHLLGKGPGGDAKQLLVSRIIASISVSAAIGAAIFAYRRWKQMHVIREAISKAQALEEDGDEGQQEKVSLV